MRRPVFAVAVFCIALIDPAEALRAYNAQQPAGLAVTALLDQSKNAVIALRLDEALAKVDEALTIAEKTGDRVGVGMSYRMKGEVFRARNGIPEAVAWYNRALETFEALSNKAGMASALNGLSSAAVMVGDTKQAGEFGNRALRLFEEIGDERGRAHQLTALIRAHVAPELETDRIDEVIAIATRLANDRLLSEGLMLRAFQEYAADNFSASRKTHEQAIAVMERTGDVSDLATAYLSLGRVFRAHADYDGALARYQKAIDLLAPTKERFTLVQATNAKAIALANLGRHKEAIANYERGLALARESGNQLLIDFMEGNLAGGLMSAGEYARAIPALEAVIAKKPERSLLGYRYSALGMALARVGRETEALAKSAEAIAIAREYKQADVLAGRLDDRSWILSRIGKFEDALAASREALAIVEDVRTRLVPSDFLKRGYADRVQSEYARAIYLLSELNRGAEAFELAEQSRARAFLDLMTARESEAAIPPRGAGVSPPPAKAGELASESLGRPVNLAGIREVAERLKTTIVTYWVSEQATFIWVSGPDGATTLTKVPITQNRVSSLVAATTVALKPASTSTVTRGSEPANPDPGSQPADDLTALPMRGLSVLALARDERTAWRELYRLLIEPVRRQLPGRGGRITIVPHGPLFQLSFAGLQSSTGRYLIEDYELHYTPAASVLVFTGRRQQTVSEDNSGPWALIGNPSALPEVGKGPLSPLPGAGRELAAIAALAPRGRALRLDGPAADESTLSATLLAKAPAVLHFATHGFVFDDPKQPPFLALNRRGKAGAEDGRLTLDEIYDLRLRADLVVLSACRTGAGKVSSDGIVGLTRGFFYAGTPTVVSTFWDVADETTASLMSRFYRRYAATRAKSSSLRAAQLALIADLRAGKVVVTAGGRRITLPEHPLLWAAFFLSGEP